MLKVGMGLVSVISLAACTAQLPLENSEPVTATEASNKVADSEPIIADIVSRMSLERKVAQLIQPQINSFTAEDMERYRFGSYLNGGNGGPYGDEFAPAPDWLRLADEMYDASTRPQPNGEPVIPTMWGTDAVHGHSNIVGATLFPHNIALGATGDTDLVRRIGHATAIEIEVTGIDWNFSPTVAVARDSRWGRTYESYSENPDLVAKLGAALIEGQQGKHGEDGYLGDGRVIATAKHFFGDGGTEQGVDQGDVNGDIDRLIDLHGRPYPAAIDAGVEAIMASFNSINGRKMHGNKNLLTDVLRGEMGFEGLVVGDWNGHGQIAGCEVTNCPQSLLAGLDIYMVPDDWKALMDSLIAQVEDGTIPMARLDEAVTRVLRVKYRAGILGENAKRPSERGMAGRFELLAPPEHRALAREAVARSQVVLKNDGILPLKAGANVLVVGSAANDIGQAAGGWTLEWQGGRKDQLRREYFPNASSIWDGIRENVVAAGGAATLSESGSFDAEPDVAIVVFGERPYAEFAGDQADLAFRDEEGLILLKKFKDAGVPTVAVFLSGRPMWVNREINAANAFVASWLPGSEGAGVADVLTGAMPSTGRLSFTWPAVCDRNPLNSPDSTLFAFGYGRELSDHSPLPTLDEQCTALTDQVDAEWFSSGRLADGIKARADNAVLPNLRGTGNGITAVGIDRDAQEDARRIDFADGSSSLIIEQDGSSAHSFKIAYRVNRRPSQPVAFTIGKSKIDVTHQLSVAAGKGWREMVLTSHCVPAIGSRIELKSEGKFSLDIASITREALAEGTACSF